MQARFLSRFFTPAKTLGSHFQRNKSNSVNNTKVKEYVERLQKDVLSQHKFHPEPNNVTFIDTVGQVTSFGELVSFLRTPLARGVLGSNNIHFRSLEPDGRTDFERLERLTKALGDVAETPQIAPR